MLSKARHNIVRAQPTFDSSSTHRRRVAATSRWALCATVVCTAAPFTAAADRHRANATAVSALRRPLAQHASTLQAAVVFAAVSLRCRADAAAWRVDDWVCAWVSWDCAMLSCVDSTSMVTRPGCAQNDQQWSDSRQEKGSSDNGASGCRWLLMRRLSPQSHVIKWAGYRSSASSTTIIDGCPCSGGLSQYRRDRCGWGFQGSTKRRCGCRCRCRSRENRASGWSPR